LEKNRIVIADFVFSFNRICDEKQPLRVHGFQSVRRNSENRVDGFVAENDSTFSIYLEKAFPPLLGLLGSAYCAVVPKEIVSKYGKDFRRNPVGTGPFIFHDWIERSALILHRHEKYFESDADGIKLPYLDAVMISFINDKQCFLEFLKRKLDLISGLERVIKTTYSPITNTRLNIRRSSEWKRHLI
jgi:peptide/nickel transport system substrate-binding protein